MVRLKNIEKNNGILTAFYDPEESGQLGTIKINAVTGEVVESSLSTYDKDFPVHFSHAVETLKQMIHEEIIPKEKLVMWY